MWSVLNENKRPIQRYLFAVNLEFWHPSPMALYRKNKYIPKSPTFTFFPLSKSPFSISPPHRTIRVTNCSRMQISDLISLEDLHNRRSGQQYPVYGRCIWQITANKYLWIYKWLWKWLLQGLIKQREKTYVTIFRLANTSLHQVYYGKSRIYRNIYVVEQWVEVTYMTWYGVA